MMLPTVLKYRLRQTYNTFTRSSRQKKLGWLLSIAFIAPYYVMVTSTMLTIYGHLSDSGWQTVVRQAEVHLAMAFFFVLISTSALTSYRLFQAKDLPLLMSLPMRSGSLFLVKLFDTLSDTFRGMILPFPVCVALASVMGKLISPFVAAAFIVGWIFVVLQLACLSLIIALILGRIIARGRWVGLLRIVAIFAAVAFLIIFMGYFRQGAPIIEWPVRFAAFFPTSWLLETLLYEGSSLWRGLMFGFGFVGMTIVFPAAALWFFGRRFHRFWMLSVETRRRGTQKSVPRRAFHGTRPMGNMRALVLKEARVIFREPHTWVGLVIPLVIFPIFVLFRGSEPGMNPMFIVLVSLLSSASYSLSCIGREGRSFPMLRSMPIRMSALLRAKFYMGCAINLVVTFAFVIALYLIQERQSSQILRNVLIAVSASIYLPAFGTALAGLFPKFDFTSPMRAASLPGLLVLYLIAFLFGVTLVGVISFRWYLAPPLVLPPWAAVALILMKISRDRLEKMDV